MDSGKQRKSEATSEETNQPEKPNADDVTGPGRSYDCNFCKRGFTNAQALGGHMNIHRKDKAKAKQQTEEYSSPFSTSKSSGELYMNSRYFSQNYSFFGTQMNQQSYFHVPNPSGFGSRPGLVSLHDDSYMGANLSLQIGPPSVEDNKEKEKEDGMENEVDLELRLGHDP